MKKILFTILICFSLLFIQNFNLNVNAQDNETAYEYLKKYSIVDNIGKVTREECITLIGRVLGFTDCMAFDYQTKLSYYMPPYLDVEFYQNIHSGYIFKATNEKIIAGRRFGEYEYLSQLFGKPVMIPYFEPEEYVTYDEAIAFIMRCLEESELELKSTYSRAIERGLIVESDTFYNKHNEPVILEDMCLLLYRMLDQNCYKYFDDSIENPQQYTYRQLLEMKIQND